jgi:hypothetical protein
MERPCTGSVNLDLATTRGSSETAQFALDPCLLSRRGERSTGTTGLTAVRASRGSLQLSGPLRTFWTKPFERSGSSSRIDSARWTLTARTAEVALGGSFYCYGLKLGCKVFQPPLEEVVEAIVPQWTSFVFRETVTR